MKSVMRLSTDSDVSSISGSSSKLTASSGVILKEGYLMKRGHKIKNWKRRWFVLREVKQLLYFKSKTMEDLRGMIELENAIIQTKDEAKMDFGILITTTSSGQYYIQAESEQGRQDWIEALNKEITSLKFVDELNTSNKLLCENVSFLQRKYDPNTPNLPSDNWVCDLDITIPNAKIVNEKTKPFTVYVIDIKRTNGEHWNVARRYRQFETLSSLLHKKFKDKYSLPGKKLLSLFKFGPQFIEKRRADLEVFLNEIIGRWYVYNTEELRAFLDPNNSYIGKDEKLTSDEIDELMVCSHFDRNELNDLFQEMLKKYPNGQMSQSQFVDFLNRLGMKNSNIVQILFKVFDLNKDSTVDFKEVVCGLSVLARGTTQERIRFAFQIYDFNGDGRLSKEEVFSIIMSVYNFVGKMNRGDPTVAALDIVDQLFLDVDVNNDGFLSLAEFEKGCLKNPILIHGLSIWNTEKLTKSKSAAELLKQ